MRYVRYRPYVVALLLLTVVFFFRAWRQVAHEVASFNSNSDDMSISGAGYEEGCEWSEGGPLLYLLQHSSSHPKGKVHATTGLRRVFRENGGLHFCRKHISSFGPNGLFV